MEDYERELEKIIKDLECPKNFRCSRAGHVKLCEAKDIGLESHILCMEKNPTQCEFAAPFGSKYFCRCPLRIYMVKKLKK